MYDGVKDIYYDLGKDLQKEISQISGKEQSEANTALRQSVEKQKNEAYLNAFKALELKRRKNKDSLNLVDLFYQGRCLNFMERNEDALKIYREIVTQDTNYISGYYLIATTTALIDPVDSTGMVTMAYQKWLDRLNEEQQEKFKKDVENAYRNMAFFAQKNKNFEMTSFYYGKVLEVNPEDEATADIKARIDDYLQKLKAREAKNKNKN
jgi:tetratricopeptide (TPR) repeat protein